MVCCRVEETSESEEAQFIDEIGLPRWQAAPEQSRDDRVVQETQEKTLVIINVNQARPRPLAAIEPEQVPMRGVQLPELQRGTYGAPSGQHEAFPADGLRQGVPERLEDSGGVLSPDLQVV